MKKEEIFKIQKLLSSVALSSLDETVSYKMFKNALAVAKAARAIEEEIAALAKADNVDISKGMYDKTTDEGKKFDAHYLRLMGEKAEVAFEPVTLEQAYAICKAGDLSLGQSTELCNYIAS